MGGRVGDLVEASITQSHVAVAGEVCEVGGGEVAVGVGHGAVAVEVCRKAGEAGERVDAQAGEHEGRIRTVDHAIEVRVAR